MDEQALRRVVKEVVEDSISPLKADIKELKDGMQTLTASVTSLEQTVGSYADSYKENQRNIERLAKRMEPVEEELGIEVPEEYRIQYSSTELLPQPAK